MTGRCKGKQLRFGVVGLGGMGQAHCQVIMKTPRAELAAVCDVSRETAEQVGRKFGVRAFSDPGKMFRSGLCDAIAVATPHPLHGPVAVAALNAGIHVLTEKPISERVSVADRMIRAARANRVVFAVIFQMRLDPLYEKALELVNKGRLGRLYRRTLILPEYRSQCYYNSGTWRATWKGEGGGVLMNQAPHIVDLFALLGGMPSEVLGRTETRMHKIEVEDLGEALLKYPDGGTGYLYCSTNEPATGVMLEFFGDKGKLIIRDNKLTFFRYEPPVKKHIASARGVWDRPRCIEEKVVVSGEPGGHPAVFRHFTQHLLDGDLLRISGESGRNSLELANAIVLSAFEGRWLKLPINRRAYDRFLEHKRRTSTFVKKVKVERRITDHRLKV